MKENKTILEWLEELPQPYRDEALANYDEEFSFTDEDFESISEALDYAFFWEDSPQGHSYWQECRDNIEGWWFFEKQKSIKREAP